LGSVVDSLMSRPQRNPPAMTVLGRTSQPQRVGALGRRKGNLVTHRVLLIVSLAKIHSTSCSRHGVGSTDTRSGRVMLVRDTSAWPGARPLTMFHSPFSMPLIDRLSRSTTPLSAILW